MKPVKQHSPQEITMKFMKANYHTHTFRCLHADGTEREYIEEAIAGGLEILGFSDHTPYPFPDGYSSGMRMELSELEEYVDTLIALRDEYKNDIEIHIGLETEYYPRHFTQLMRFCEDYPIEYFLLAQHALNNEYDGPYSGYPISSPDAPQIYVEQLEEAMDTGKFLYLAHPDLLYFTGDEALYEKWMRRLCRSAAAHDLPLEINLLGIEDRRNYPDPLFWKIAGEEGMSAVLGADAHHRTDVCRPDAEAAGIALAQRFGIHLSDGKNLLSRLKVY